MALITYNDKSNYQSSSLANEYKISASDMNQIKNAINNATTYSTTEQVVGTYIDGKPIYKSTFTYSISTGNSNYDISSLNIDNVVFENHLCKRYSTGGNTDYEGPYYSGANDYFRAFVRVNLGTIETRLQNTATTNTQISTIEYTKTTD